MEKASRMQGVPAHLTIPKAKGKRRHPAHCIYHEGKGEARVCNCRESSMYMLHCKSASKCDHYDEENN